MKTIKIPIMLLLAAVLVGVVSCQDGTTATSPGETTEPQSRPDRVSLTNRQIETAGIETGKLSRSSVSELVKANGMIQLPPNDRAAINAPFESFIHSVYHMEGARVRKGDILVSLKHPNFIQLQQQYQQAASQYNFLKKEIERQQILSDSLVTAKKQLQQTRAEFESARSQTNALAEQLKLIGVNPDDVVAGNIQATVYLRSPFSGVVTKVTGFRGQAVLPQQPIMEVISREHLYLELNVFEKSIGKVRSGQEITFRVTSSDDSTAYWGKVSAVGGALDLTSRTVPVIVRFAPRAGLIPGLYVEAQIRSQPKPGWVLPEAAVLFDGDEPYVFVQADPARAASDSGETAFVRTPVTIGRKNGGLTQIMDGGTLSPASRIVVRGANYLKSEINKGESDDN